MTAKDRESDEEVEGKAYCICRQPWDGAQLMIQCDTCEEWFHGLCVDITKEESESYKRYECDSCSSKPGATGSVIYSKEQLEEMQREEDRQAAEDEAKEEARERAAGRSKRRKNKEKDSSSPPPAPKAVEEIPGELRTTVRKVFTTALEKHIQSTSGEKVDGPTTAVTDKLADTVDAIEAALHEQYRTGDEYRNQFRFLVLNIKRQENAHVRERLLQGELSPSEFVVMTADELASKDLTAYRRKREADLDKQIIREASSGPVYRNTHKGVERITGGEDGEGGLNEAFDPGRGPIKPKTEEEEDAEGPAPGTHTTASTAPGHATTTPGGQGSGATGGQGELEMPDFDDFDAFARSTEQAEELTGEQVGQDGHAGAGDVPSVEPYDEEEDTAAIDHNDEDQDAVTVPKASASVIWKGECGTPADSSMFPATASFLCGRAAGHKFELPALLPSRLLVHGRMRTEAMAKYLNDVNNSDKRELSLLLLNPDLDLPNGEAGYQRLHALLTELGRVAVIPPPGGDHPFTDIYVTAIQASSPPAFIPVPVPKTREDRLILVVVSKWNHGPAAPSARRGSSSSKSHGSRGERSKRSHSEAVEPRHQHQPRHQHGAKRARHAPPPAPAPVAVAAPLAGGALPPHLFATITELIKQSEASKAGSDNGNTSAETGGASEAAAAAAAAPPPTRSWADPIAPAHAPPPASGSGGGGGGRGPAIHPERLGQYNSHHSRGSGGHHSSQQYRHHHSGPDNYRHQHYGQRGRGGGGGRYDDRYHRR